METINRSQRRRLRNREKLMQATQSIIIEKGVNALNPRLITAKADLGLGTFYNHFKTVSEIIDAVVDLIVQHHLLETARITAEFSDPAEIAAMATRFNFHKIADNDTWRRLVMDSGIQIDYLAAPIVQRASNNIEVGLSTGRFKVDDIEFVMSIIRGSLVSVAIDIRKGKLGFEREKSFAVFFLKMLGLDENEAIEICNQPFPSIKISNPPLKALDENQQKLLES